MKWYVGGLDSSKVSYLPDLPSYDSSLSYYLIFGTPLSSIGIDAEGYVYEFQLTDKELLYLGKTSSGSNKFGLADNEFFCLQAFTIVISDDESVSSQLGVSCNTWIDNGTDSFCGGIDSPIDLVYSNYNVLSSDGTIYEVAGKTYDGDWWLYQFIGLPALPTDRYDYNVICRTEYGPFLCSFDKPPEYVLNTTTDIYKDQLLFQGEFNYIYYELYENEWSLCEKGTDSNTLSDYCWVSWAGFGLCSYSSMENIGTENRLWVYDLVSVNGNHYECSDYLPYGDSDGYEPDDSGGSGGTGGDDSGNTGGGTEPDNPSGGGTTETPNTNSAFMMGYMVGKALRLSR